MIVSLFILNKYYKNKNKNYKNHLFYSFLVVKNIVGDLYVFITLFNSTFY